MKKKGQAMMDFFLVYGWAILIVVFAIGALWYFGVLSPKNLLPDKDLTQNEIYLNGSAPNCVCEYLGSDVTAPQITNCSQAKSLQEACVKKWKQAGFWVGS